MARITLIGKPGCHLCDDQRAVIVAVSAETGATWEELSVTDSPELADEYWLEVPAVLVDDIKIGYWVVTTQQIRDALDRGSTVTPL
ncbi:MAG: hypothetical protein RL441_677 [Actinomycetota bacterium]